MLVAEENVIANIMCDRPFGNDSSATMPHASDEVSYNVHRDSIIVKAVLRRRSILSFDRRQ